MTDGRRWPAWAEGLVLLLAAAALWEAATALLGIRPSTLPRLSAILAAVAATPGPMPLDSRARWRRR